MNKASIRLLRGESWGQRLQEVLAASPLPGVKWMEQQTELLKTDTHSRVGLIQLHDALCYLKFYQTKSVGQRVLFRLGYARGLRSFDAATELLAASVQVPTPLACLALPGGMMLLTQGVSGGVDLKALWRENLTRSRGEELLVAAGRALAKLHAAGFSHGDCKWSNFLWSDRGFFLVDLEGVKKAAPGARRQARDLARFTVNAEDLGVAPESFELFLESYLAGGQGSRDTTVRAIMPPLRHLRRRHRRKYGPRGHPILRES